MTESGLTAEIREIEERLLAPSVRRSAEELENLLSDGFLEFGSSGEIWTKERIVEELPRQSGTKSYAISGFRVEKLGKNFALATYRLVTKDASGKERTSLRSSVWRSEPCGWRLLFHQGTRTA